MKKTSALKVKTGLTAGGITVYGSPTCPWCKKQQEYFTQKGVSFEFTDCSSQACPDFVKAYPTTVSVGFINF
ncbi:MAG: hypothetical protein BWK80_52820 [Desulfobacteraceae bacterium IS3]|nr:MAG: hypothetical protein BWK80_52820 [Desulfobacteraceae bacterium IS3]